MKENEEFNKYVNSFKKLSTGRKKEETIKQMKEMLAFIWLLKEKTGIPFSVLYNREIIDAKDKTVSEDDFVEAVFVYIHIIKEAFAEYVDSTIGKEEL